MKKTLLIAATILSCAPFVHNAFAAEGGGVFTQSTAGEKVVIGVTVDGAQDIEFNPSTNVSLVGVSNDTSFGIAAYHEQAVKKSSGQAYAMMADSNKMYFMDISPAGVTLPTATTVPTALVDVSGSTTWFEM